MDSEKQTSISKTLNTENGAYRRTSSLSLRRDTSNLLPSTSRDEGGDIHETPKRQKIDNTSNVTFNGTDQDSVPASPWEWRRMRGELITLKTKVSHQDDTIKHLHTLRKEMEEVFRKEKKMLEIQIEQDKNVIKQLELRVDVGRRTVQDAKSAQVQAERDLIEMKSKMEHKILSLVQDNTKLTDELRQLMKEECQPDVAALLKFEKKKTSDLEERLDGTNKRISELEVKLREAREYQQKFEVQSVELQSLKVKIESLESESINWEEGKKFTSRAAKSYELEKELKQAKEIIASLRQCVQGKLLLEEQMHTVQQRLLRTENLEQQVSQLECKQAELLSKIAEYESVGITGGPLALRYEISRLQNAELCLTAQEGQLRSTVDSLQKQLELCQQKHEETKKSLTDATATYDRLTRFVGRLQKKLSLVTRERDSYRQQLDTYEKEMTSNQMPETPNVLNERIPALERAIEGYRELVAKLEADLEAAEGIGGRDENKKLREELEKLKGELEHRALKGDFNPSNTRILHFKFNPLTLAAEAAEDKQRALLQEVEQLRAIVSSGNHSGTPAVSSVHAQEIAELTQKFEIKISRLKEAFKASSHEYRHACCQLFGWRVDRVKEGQYKLMSQYAESPDDYLFFIVNEEGVNMIETPFSATLSTFIEAHLQRQQSVPMFLNAVQCDLFGQQTSAIIIG